MHSVNQSENVEDIVQHRKERKNYAPVNPMFHRLPDSQVGVVHPNTLYRQRQQKRAQNQPQQLPSVPLPPRKENNNRANALRRIQSKICNCPISPYLKLTMYGGMSIAERFDTFNRNHKCKHGLRFNLLDFSTCLCNKECLKLSCDHEREKMTDCKADKCKACGHFMFLVERDCYCIVHSCSFCHRSQYLYNEHVTQWCNCRQTKESIQSFMNRMNKSKPSSIRLKPWSVKESIPEPIPQPLPVARQQRFKKFNKKTAKPMAIVDPQQPVVDPVLLRVMRQSGEYPPEHYVMQCLNYKLSEVVPVAKSVLQTHGLAFSLFLLRQKTDSAGIISKFLDEVGEGPRFSQFCFIVGKELTYDDLFYLGDSVILTEFVRKFLDDYFIMKVPGHSNFYSGVPGMGLYGWDKNSCRIKNLMAHMFATTIQKQGGALSTASGLLSTSYSKIQEFLFSFLNTVQSMLKASGAYIKQQFIRIKSQVKALYIGNYISALKDAFTQFPGLAISVFTSISQLFTESTKTNKILNLITLGSLLASVAQVAKNTFNTSQVVKLIKFCKSPPSSLDSDNISSSSDNSSFSSEDEEEAKSIIEEVVAETDNLLKTDLYKVGEKIEKQSGDDEQSFFGMVLTTLGTYLGFAHDVVRRSLAGSMSYVRDFNIIWTTKRNVTDLVGCFLKFLPTWVKNLFSAQDSKLYVKLNLNDVTTPLGLAFHETLTYSIMCQEDANLDQIEQQKVTAKAAILAWYKYASDNKILLDADLMRVNAIMDRFMISVTKPRIRDNEPFVIRISGASGVGKSTLWPILMSVIPEFQDVTDVRDIISKTYSRQIGDEYWTGYNQQPIVLYDDFGQDRDETDFKELINVVSRAPYLPNMASINPNDVNVGVKGTQFTSRYIVILSNTTDFNPVHLTSAEALNRRRHIHFLINFKQGCEKQRLEDFSHCDIQLLHAEGIHDRTHDFVSVAKKLPLDLDGAMDLVSKTFERYSVKQQGVTASVNKFLFRNRIQKQGGASNHNLKAKIAIDDLVSSSDHKCSGDCTLCKRYGQVPWAYSILQVLKSSAYSLFEAVIAGIGVMTGLFIGLKIVGWFVNTDEQETEIERESGHNKTPKYAKPQRIRVETDHAIEKQGGPDDVVRLVQQNTVRLHHTDGQGNSQNGVFVCGRIILTNRHFFSSDTPGQEYIPHDTRITIFSPTTKEDMVVEFDTNCLYPLYNHDGIADACLYVLPPSIAARRSLLHLFWHGDVSLSGRYFAVAHINKHKQCGVYRGLILKDNQTIVYNMNNGGEISDYVTHTTFSYAFRSQIGDCGTPIVCEDNRLPTSIVGIHCGGLGETAYGLIVTRSMIAKAMDSMDPELRIHRQSGGIKPATPDDAYEMDLPGKIIAYGVTDIKYMPPGKTVIQPSILFDKIVPHTTIPAKLNMFEALSEGVDIMRKGIAKYSHPSPDIPEELVEQICDNMKRINTLSSVVVRRVLTIHEAINGLQEYPHMARMNMKTSAGFPYSFDPRYRGDKSKLFTVDDNGDYIPCEQLREDIEETLSLMRSGIIPELPFIDCLKDERRPIEKVNAFKTRVFSICPVVMTIITRMYMLPFVSHLTQSRHNSHSALGINKNSIEWHRMMLRLMEVSNYGVDGDYTEFDGRSHKRLMRMHYELAADFYGCHEGEDFTVRQVLSYYMCESLHLFFCPKSKKCYVYMCNGGNPSGQGETTPNNTNVNEAALQLAWLELAPLEKKDLTCYNSAVRTVIYGDDNIYAADPKTLEWFSPMAIQSILAKYGMIYGPADKKSAVGSMQKLKDCSFLKCNTGDFYGWMVPLMHDDALLETLNWIRQDKNSPTPLKCCEDNCNDVLRSLFFYGEHRFNQIRSLIKAERPDFSLLSYSYLKGQFLCYGSVYDPYNSFGYIRNKNETLNKYNLETLEVMA